MEMGNDKWKEKNGCVVGRPYRTEIVLGNCQNTIRYGIGLGCRVRKQSMPTEN